MPARRRKLAQIRPNKAKHKLEQGGTVIVLGGSNDAEFIDQVGPLGFDAVWIEGEHGPVDFKDIPGATRACDLWGMTSVVRVNLNLPGVIYRTLDVGAQGIVVPHVNTADEARAVVDAAKFGPIGHRGAYTSRQGFGVPDYVARANDETLLVILIEDIIAVNNLADILTVDHIDVFFVAPGDLAQSMGYPGQANHPDVQAIVDKAVAQINAAGKVAGGVTSEATVVDDIRRGVRFLNMNWTALLTAAATGFLEKAATAGS
jgi:4-hydroxy-2-oxoheptanedioate aldolase